MNRDEAAQHALRTALDEYLRHRDGDLTPEAIGNAAQRVWVDNARQVAQVHGRPLTAWLLGRLYRALERRRLEDGR